MGRRTAVMLTSFAHLPAEAAVAQALGVPSDQMPQRSVRVGSVDGGPFSHLTTYVPESISPTFTQQELASRPLFDLLERAGVKIEQARQRISARLAARDVAVALSARGSTINLAAGSCTCMRCTDRSGTGDCGHPLRRQSAALGEGVHHVGY
jgi:DNA-binding GntR family transcriptional regulator